ncbi:hypothetical protein IU470_11420 [Nocardia abscessus]|uniref:Secreted protein n=1 Tax=Nocardia abscessus TaxID=120957 RepID=A0ABS0C5Q3_9NOCA|nr:hypothetical protein [Nocardia abscessus]MBF6225709.1 hypothetical protein [Nocardia abscessus]
MTARKAVVSGIIAIAVVSVGWSGMTGAANAEPVTADGMTKSHCEAVKDELSRNDPENEAQRRRKSDDPTSTSPSWAPFYSCKKGQNGYFVDKIYVG